MHIPPSSFGKASMRLKVAQILLAIALALLAAPASLAQCPASVPVEGAAPTVPLPLFPSNNWWNLDISSAPVDSASASYIAFINNGGTRHLHPDFGGDAPTQQDPYGIYGMPYVVVSGA